jgi:hypothetical protein
MSFCFSLAAHCIHLHSFAICSALHPALLGLMINAGDASLLTGCVPGVRVRHCPYSPLRSSLISLQFNSMTFPFRSLSLLRLSSQFSLGEFRPSDVPLNHAAYDGTLKVRSNGGHWSIIASDFFSSPHHHRSLLQLHPPPLALPCFLGQCCHESSTHEIHQASKTEPLRPVTH